MSILKRLFAPDTHKLRESIASTKESLARLEILTNELNKKEDNAISQNAIISIGTHNLDEPIWGKGLDHRFVFLNPACAEKILHASVDEGLAMTDADFKDNALATVCMDSDDIVSDTEKTRRQIEYAKYDDGEYVFLDTTKSPWYINGELVGTVGFGRVVTDFVNNDVKKMCRRSGSVELPIDSIYNSKELGDIVLGKSSADR